MFVTRARIALPDPAAVVAPLCAHMVEHEASVETGPGEARIALDGAAATLTSGAAELGVRVEASELAALRAMRFAIASHVVEFAPAGAQIQIRWEGDGAGPSPLPDFRILAVTAVETLTPHMRRIHFSGEDLGRYDTLEALHVRLFFPPAEPAEPIWPMLGEDGLPIVPPAEKRPAIRKYTIRSIDAAAGTVAIDFVLHDDAGPGSAFANRNPATGSAWRVRAGAGSGAPDATSSSPMRPACRQSGECWRRCQRMPRASPSSRSTAARKNRRS